MSEQIPSLASTIRNEAARFESIHKTLDNLHGLLQEIDNIPVKIRMRKLVNKIEGKFLQGNALHTVSCNYDCLSLTLCCYTVKFPYTSQILVRLFS